MHKIESPKLRAKISAHGTRDLQEVVTEIRDDFATASSFGKEVAMLLEAGKVPYQPRFSLHKVILSRIAYMVAPSSSSSHPPARRSVRYTFRTMKLAKSYYEDLGKNTNMKPCNLSSTLEKLYVWEKKLYKEVKDEERLRVIYEKQCKRLKVLDDRGAESSKIDATRLQLRRMWKTTLKCHQKQFQAIMESKTSLRANTRSRRDSNLRATIELEMELRAWFSRFSEWIKTQKSFIESLNGWLLRCLVHEPEESPDGIVPFSPGRIGAPPIFVICNDWFQAMETISEIGAPNAIRNFASSLLQLWEKQDEEQKQRLKAEYLSKDFEKRLKTLRMERGRMEQGQDAMSDKTSGSLVPSENGVSPLDDLKVDLDSMRKRLEEEKARHKEAAKLVHNAASSSLQGGLIPIFEELSNFTSEALKAYEHVRIENQSQKTGGK
ncbi:Nitrate regulatory gene2 protein [Camellia lanceoleosa]|uniref:Nitrate regulatory gene2 protein n=1 Tax=Camellia lanceoleosa TaxID=1840588 RepID=A0ACC0GVB2_9ERIC|nr:Nitrate regulatory gene2 protein [Camellia lanceoleosa]